ncbi:MAG: sensor domain-containing protein [Solirubrobacteraceae bacterium]
MAFIGAGGFESDALSAVFVILALLPTLDLDQLGLEMDLIRPTLADPATYRRLVYLLLALPLGLAWFVALVTVWSLCLGLVITPFVIPLLIGLAAMTRGFAAVEAEIARSLLDVDARVPAPIPASGGFWARFRAMFGAGFWRAQAFLLIRWFAGFPIAVALLSLLAAALGMIVAPIWVPFFHGGVHLGFWRPHTFLESVALVPAGLVLLPATLLVVNPLAAVFRPAVFGLLSSPTELPRARGTSGRAPWTGLVGGIDVADRPAATAPPRRAFEVHAAVDGVVVFVLVLIWTLTSRAYFWPIWVVLPLALALGIHGWFVLIAERPSLVGHFRDSRALTGTAGVGAALSLYFIAIWAITGHGYFWPVWPMLGIAIVFGAVAVAALLVSPGHAEMAERIETLESTRAGAVDVQDSELRRIERDLHDGAQARLVALGMSLGMAEQKLADDPERVGELLAEARMGAEQALRELRDLARGIHPPVLADRGLEAALQSLTSSTPMKVALSVDLDERPAPAVESAAYFVAAEALANAAKHARAKRLEIRIARIGDLIDLHVQDDGVGGANPDGSGLRGLRRRVEALDGTLSVISPPGGPTRIRAQLPCAL